MNFAQSLPQPIVLRYHGRRRRHLLVEFFVTFGADVGHGELYRWPTDVVAAVAIDADRVVTIDSFGQIPVMLALLVPRGLFGVAVGAGLHVGRELRADETM